MKHLLYLCFIMLLLAGCKPKPGDNVSQSSELPPIYPDYTDVTLPVNIAPMNFLVRADGCDAVQVVVERVDGSGAKVRAVTFNVRGQEVTFGMNEWKDLLAQAAGKAPLQVTLTARINGQWVQYKPFSWTVVADKLDPYLTYRLIEPDYEIYNNLELRERCIENYDERPISTFALTGNRCMNCHTFASQNPQLSMLYVRGEGGGPIINRNGRLQKLDIPKSVYFCFHPAGRYLVYSTNKIIPAFHSRPANRLEVFDSESDVFVADLEQGKILRSGVLADSLMLETFPTFSPDGRSIYFCTSRLVNLPQDVRQLQYSLCRVAFDASAGTIGEKVDTIVSASAASHEPSSVCHPRVSPDGRYLLFTVQRYGTFPIWHPEADLRMLDLQSGQMNQLANVNCPTKSDTYHSWSSNSRWFVFASKRDDGLYGKPYFSYVDRQGRAHKPFCLPQRHPQFYDHCLRSFNAPELGKGRLPFRAADVADALKQDARLIR